MLPLLSQPHAGGPFPSESPQLCVSQGATTRGWGPPRTAHPLPMPHHPCQLGKLRQQGRRWLAQGPQCQGWGEQTGFLAGATLCLQARAALCWVCSFAAALHPSSGSLGAVPVSPQVTPLALVPLNGAVVPPGGGAVCGGAGTESSSALAPCPLPCPFPEAAACGHGLAAVPAAGSAGQDPAPLGCRVTSGQGRDTRGHRCREFEVLSSAATFPPEFLCQLHP